MADLGGCIERSTCMVGDLAGNIIKLTVVFVTQGILQPFSFLWLLAMTARGIARMPLEQFHGSSRQVHNDDLTWSVHAGGPCHAALDRSSWDCAPNFR